MAMLNNQRVDLVSTQQVSVWMTVVSTKPFLWSVQCNDGLVSSIYYPAW